MPEQETKTSLRPYKVLRPVTDVVTLTRAEVEELVDLAQAAVATDATIAESTKVTETLNTLVYADVYEPVGAPQASKAETACRAAYRRDRDGTEGELIAVAAGSFHRVPYKPKPPADNVPVVFG